ncbi:MAG: hypothetical protein AAF433_18430 [Bacteroidota bacterium]
MTYYQPSSISKSLRINWRAAHEIPLVSESLLKLRVPNPLPYGVVFSSTPPLKVREPFHYLFGPGLVLALGLGGLSNQDSTTTYLFGLVCLLLGLIVAAHWYLQEQGSLFPKRAVVISRTGIQIPPTGEFLWKNIDQVFLERYLWNSPCLMIQLRNGTLVKHRLRRRYYSPSLRGKYRNYGALRHTLYEYYLLSRKKRDLSIEQPSLWSATL